MKTTQFPDLLPVASLAELQAKGVIVIVGRDRPIAVFWHEGEVHAVDNRCPHLGFPLHRGSVRDGLLTCHWHEARFDLCTGCTFDLWADDVPAFDTFVRDGTVYVAPNPRQKESRHYYLRRLTQGLEQEVSLVQAKAVLGLRRIGVSANDIIREIARFGSRNHDRWGEGMTLLAIAGNLLPELSPETAYHVLFRASRQVGADCSDAPARREREALADREHPPAQLARWMRTWVRARHRDASERVLLTAIERHGESPDLADLVFTTAADRVYAQIGHVLDGWNKAFELLDSIGWNEASSILPLVVQPTVSARGAEEDAHWHHPHELIEPLRTVEAELPAILERGARRGPAALSGSRQTSEPPPRALNSGEFRYDAEFLPVLLGENPVAILELLKERLLAGVAPQELSKQVAYAAAVRLARFSDNNEVADWFNPRHTFIFANAVHQAVKRNPSAGIVRGIFHAALSVYMDRFLNVPPARLRDDDRTMHALPSAAPQLRQRVLDLLDRQSNTDEAALVVARYLRLGHEFTGLVDTLSLATAREDLDFHALQVLEAAVQQCREWGEGPEIEQIMVGVARQLAAFCPTPRAAHHTAVTAMRLDRGDKMYEE